MMHHAIRPTGSLPATGSMPVRLTAEAFGSFILVIAVVGTMLFASLPVAQTTGAWPGSIAAALAGAAAVTAASYAFGPISGGHLNPVVTIGIAAAGRMPWRDVPAYIIAQTIGGLVATTIIFLVGLFGPDGWLEAQRTAGFASNGFGPASPAGFGLGAAIIVEALFAAILVIVVLSVTHPSRGTSLSGVVIGLAYGVALLALAPIDNASVNPARSIATALYGDLDALAQLWVFLVFPLVGAVLAGLSYRGLFDTPVPRSDADS